MITINDELTKLFRQKGSLSKDVTDATYKTFSLIKEALPQLAKALTQQVTSDDERLRVSYTDRGPFEVEIKVADDVIIFIMHTNSFVFDPSHPVLKSGYVNADPARGTCGMISVYNFLSDSFKFDRRGDSGQLIARIFVNKEGHFFVEGRRQLGILFNDYANTVATPESIQSLIESCIVYSLDIDVIVPPMETMREITVNDAIQYTLQSAVSISKRLGFKFRDEAETDTKA